ncbi:putative membrane protein [Helicobacter pylori Hp A-9]|uniref:Putative membrane protein n=1 Tax=Helicobacter pylori Hp A-9 TaxID=992034 RepID=J0K622_HELPX|nr:putative membrane protein [Helicobacter pylori Hp A-9]
MVKERLEEARNSPKGNFYLPLLWGSFGGLWLSFIFCFFSLLFY